MSRLTGSDALGLFEAYQAVYNPQELTEDQLWEEVENWVNSLLEEGYDLSEYTWEEMYESYLGEGGAGPRAGTTPSTPSRPYMGPLSAGGGRAAIDKLTAKGVDPRKANVMVLAQGEKNLRANPAAAPAARPAATASAKPSGPATGMLGKTSFERRTPTSSELKAAQSARASGASPEKALQAAKSAGGALSQATAAASKPAAFSPSSTSTPTPTATPKPSLQQSIRNRRLNMNLDLFDIVKGHLLGEGYADTEEAALVIMINMSEEWRQSIVEAEVLAQKGGVAGSVKVKPALNIPGTSIGVGPNRPVPGTFTTTTPEQRQKISQGDTTIDRGIYKQSRVGAGPTANERQRYNTQLTLSRTPGKLMSQ